MATRLSGLTKLTLQTAPSVCHECIWWQTRGRREIDKDRWMEKVELEFGAPVDPAPFENGRRAELVSVVRNAIAAML